MAEELALRDLTGDAVAVPVALLGMSKASLEAYFASLGEKPFRAVQVMKWLHHRDADDFATMTDLSRALRARL
jgi:23S rRNA (adenine2503-C2)-methyltransferase